MQLIVELMKDWLAISEVVGFWSSASRCKVLFHEHSLQDEKFFVPSRWLPWSGTLSLVSSCRWNESFGVENLLKFIVGAAELWLLFAPIFECLAITILEGLDPEAILILAPFRAVQFHDELWSEGHIGIVAICRIEEQPWKGHSPVVSRVRKPLVLRLSNWEPSLRRVVHISIHLCEGSSNQLRDVDF